MFQDRTWILFLLPVLMGIIVGVGVLFPVNEFVFFYEHTPDVGRAVEYAGDQLLLALGGQLPVKVLFYAAVGLVLGLFSALFYNSLYARTKVVHKLSEELGKNLEALIAGGESAHLEFKSSFRWDYKDIKANRSLEDAVVKTLAGFLNGEGGTLIIGVDDRAQVLGLENDYSTLKQEDRDGFEQAIMAKVASKIGGDITQHITTVFHVIEGKEVCRIIASPSHRPIYVKEGDQTKFYLRMGVSTRELNVQDAVEYINERWG